MRCSGLRKRTAVREATRRPRPNTQPPACNLLFMWQGSPQNDAYTGCPTITVGIGSQDSSMNAEAAFTKVCRWGRYAVCGLRPDGPRRRGLRGDLRRGAWRISVMHSEVAWLHGVKFVEVVADIRRLILDVRAPPNSSFFAPSPEENRTVPRGEGAPDPEEAGSSKTLCASSNDPLRPPLSTPLLAGVTPDQASAGVKTPVSFDP